jgi:hypothetical protein
MDLTLLRSSIRLRPHTIPIRSRYMHAAVAARKVRSEIPDAASGTINEHGMLVQNELIDRSLCARSASPFERMTM